MDWLCPGYSEVLAKQLNTYHGNVTAYNTIRDIVSIVQTGDLHIAIYDLSRGLLYVANARADDESGSLYAYDRYVCGRRRIETRERASSKWLCLISLFQNICSSGHDKGVHGATSHCINFLAVCSMSALGSVVVNVSVALSTVTCHTNYYYLMKYYGLAMGGASGRS